MRKLKNAGFDFSSASLAYSPHGTICRTCIYKRNNAMNEDKLTIEEILCLVWHGASARGIKRMSLADFDRLYDENQLQFDEWLEKAERIFDRQQELGIRTLSIQDEELLRQGRVADFAFGCHRQRCPAACSSSRQYRTSEKRRGRRCNRGKSSRQTRGRCSILVRETFR